MLRNTFLRPRTNLNYEDSRMLNGYLGRIGYSLRRYYIDSFHFQHVPDIAETSLVLDLGGNRINKRGAFDIEKYSFRVIYVNISTLKRPDIQADAAYIPFAESEFDAAICSELLEHVPDPTQILRELSRVLRSGAICLVCVPFLYPIHGDPHDFGRYTNHYWVQNLTLNGFKDVEIEWQGQFWSVVVDMFREFYYQMLKNRQKKSWYFKPALSKIIGRAKRLAITWDEKPENRQNSVYGRFTTGFGIKAVRR